MRLLIGSLVWFIILIYPIVVYFGIQHFEPWKIATLLLVLLILRLLSVQFKVETDKNGSRLFLIVAIVYSLFAIWDNNSISLRFYPVLVNFSLLIVFVTSLFFPPPIIERIARLQHPDLPDQGIRYTRIVTHVWCVFFFINGSIALTTALWSSFAWWSLYNGFISYLLMALLMSGEYLVRIKTQPHVR